MRHEYLISCVQMSCGQWVTDMVDRAREVSVTTFRRRCLTREWEARMGYDRDLRVWNDYHVRYYRSVYRGAPCYFAVHSAIEYVFVLPGTAPASP